MRKHLIILVSTCMTLILVACGTNMDDTDPDNNRGNNENHGEELEDNGEPVSNNESEDIANDWITETGIYNGQADPHTIEIETAEGPIAFQLTIEARDDIEALIEGREVTYHYTEDGLTRTIQSIEMKE